MDEKKTVRRVTAVGIAGNIVLVIFKLYAGIAGKSEAMVSDAVHSFSDVFATVVAYIGVRVSRKAPDSAHPYGHDRFECLASMILGLILCGTGIGIGISGAKTIIAGNYDSLTVPGTVALIAAAVSIAVKEAMFWYTRHYAKKIGSSAFMADAWHHRSDALSSVGSLVGIAFAKNGFPVMDSVACVIISLMILKVGFDILKDAVSKMLDTSCGEDWDREMTAFILSQPGVDAVDSLLSRKFGDRIYLDVEIAVDGALSLNEAHKIAEDVHNTVEKEYPRIKHIMIHENPSSAPGNKNENN
ncbi:MAG: cation diffusion facilitator family transporter [Clostridia bacterium]|nr:cation diffusion facilitator family transporter [Clostridia bacterium]